MSTQPVQPYRRRRQFIVDKQFQSRFVLRFLLIVVASILCSHLITLGFIKLRDLSAGSSQSLMYLSTAIQPSLSFTRVFEVLWLPLLISGLLGCLLVAVLGIFFSHRIAGPLFNLKRMMQQVEDGNLDVKMCIRNHDEFHDVEEAFNRMVTGLRAHMQELEQVVDRLPEDKRKELAKILRDMRVN